MAISGEHHFGIARKIVSNMTSESWEQIPHAVMNYEPDVTEFMKECKKLNDGNTDPSKKITINTVMIKVICEGLKQAPKLHAHLEFNRRLVRGCLKTFDHVDVSMPMILPNGEMMTINMHDMGSKTLTEMTEAINDAARKAKNTDLNEVMFEVSLDNTLNNLKHGKIAQTVNRLYGSKTGKHKVHTLKGNAKKEYYSIPETDRLTKHDIEQGTITITNLGSIYRPYRGECCLLEIIPPQVAAIAINAAQKRPVVTKDADGKDQITIGMVMPMAIAMDHRAVDYGDMVPFFQKLDEIFANPSVIHEWK